MPVPGEVLTSVISEYADFYYEAHPEMMQSMPPPEGWVEVESYAPGITRAFVPSIDAMERKKPKLWMNRRNCAGTGVK